MTSDWISQIVSAWTGHRSFAEWLVEKKNNPIIVELGVDYGFSTFVFGNKLKSLASNGKIYGIDLFEGDIHTGFRNTFELVSDKLKTNHLENHVEIIKGEFTKESKKWIKPIDILHIDGLHTYDAVKNDYLNWSKFVKDDGVILFHDICVPQFTVVNFFRELSDGYKLYFTHSAGLGIFTKNKELKEMIIENFKNCIDYNLTSL